MNIGSIIKKVGGAIVKSVIPGGGVIIDLVNELLPNDNQLGGSATGTDIEAAINGLPPDERDKLLAKKLDIEETEIKEWSNVIGTLAQADATGASTRPRIAHIMAYIVAGTISLFVLVWAGSIAFGKTETLKQLGSSWPMMLSVLGPPVALLRAYFGMRTKEKQSRYSGAFGMPMPGGLISTIVSAIKR